MYRFSLKSKVTCHSRVDNIVVASWFKELPCEAESAEVALRWMEAEMRKEFEDKDIYINVETRIVSEERLESAPPAASGSTDAAATTAHRFRI
jgi:hypothetical protein